MQTQAVKFYSPAASLQTEGQHWSVADIEALFKLPFSDLLYRAQQIHREHFDPNAVQLSTLLSIKTGGCSEDCGYCPQSAFHNAGVENKKMLDVSEVVKAAKAAQDAGADRFCMGAAWREPSKEDMAAVVEMVKEVRALGMETCATLGMLNDEQTEQLRVAGLDYYNHNLDTTPEFYGSIISTRDYQDRLDTLDRVRKAGMHVCSGGIVGMGETSRNAPDLSRNWRIWSRIPRACRSIIWLKSKAHRWRRLKISTLLILCAPSPWRASPCPPPACVSPPDASR